MTLRVLGYAVMAAGLLGMTHLASAQPTDLDVCSSTALPWCDDTESGQVETGCNRAFDLFIGRVTWYPLQCVGPITIAVESIAIPSTHFPTYVEVVRWREPPAPCVNDPGYVVFTVRGVGDDCGGWETSSPIDITRFVPVGSLYAIRLHYFFSPNGAYGASPATDCLRVMAIPTSSGLEARSWGSMKMLYRSAQ